MLEHTQPEASSTSGTVVMGLPC